MSNASPSPESSLVAPVGEGGRARPATPRIRSVLLVTHLVILALPLAGLVGMRFYETELIRRTETELYAQGAFITEAYRQAVLETLRLDAPGVPDDALAAEFGRPAAPRWLEEPDPESELRPITPTLSRGGRILPPAPEPAPGGLVDPVSRAAGDYITPILVAGKNVTLAGIRVLDFNGTEVANTRGDASGPSLLGWEEVPRALDGEVVSVLRQRISDEPRPSLSSPSRRTRVRVFVAMPILHGDRVLGAVVLSRTPLSLAKGLYNNRRPLGIAGFVLLSVVMLLSRFSSRTIARPMDRLVEQTRRIARGDEAAAEPLEKPGTFEADQLSRAMARMARELGEREQYIRTFATSVSHEFKTPLTAVRGAVELLHDHWETMSDDERERFLDVIGSETERLERLVRRVLELARADVARPGDERADAVAVARAVAGRERTADARIRVATPERACGVAIDPDTLDTLLSALVANAVQHGGDDVALEVRSVGGTVEFVVSDDGAGVSEANRGRIFESFFTTDREGGGTGVGLAIVRSLCDSHGGSVDYERVDGRSRFVVRLPGQEA